MANKYEGARMSLEGALIDSEQYNTLIACPQCSGDDPFCMHCSGLGEVTETKANEWHRQND